MQRVAIVALHHRSVSVKISHQVAVLVDGELRTELQRRYGLFVRIERVEPERVDYSRLLRFLL